MKLYDGGRAPNPRRVRIFCAEKGITLPSEQVDLASMQHRSEAYRKLNPMQRLPALELDDGAVIAESIAICRYLEALHPDPLLFGRTPREQGLVTMWERRAELYLLTPVSYVFRHTHPSMKPMEGTQYPEWGEANRQRALDFLRFLDGELSQRAFVAGDTYSVADITAMVGVDFMKPVKLEVPQELTQVRRWHADVSARPSAKA